MSEHVSVETARTLQAAGLERKWQAGDWYVWQDQGHGADERVLGILHVAWFTSRAAQGLYVPLFLPRADDLLQELAQRRRLVKIVAAHWEWGAKQYGSWLLDVQLRGGYRQMFEHADLAEAAAAALLAVLQEEVQS